MKGLDAREIWVDAVAAKDRGMSSLEKGFKVFCSLRHLRSFVGGPTNHFAVDCCNKRDHCLPCVSGRLKAAWTSDKMSEVETSRVRRVGIQDYFRCGARGPVASAMRLRPNRFAEYKAPSA